MITSVHTETVMTNLERVNDVFYKKESTDLSDGADDVLRQLVCKPVNWVRRHGYIHLQVASNITPSQHPHDTNNGLFLPVITCSLPTTDEALDVTNLWLTAWKYSVIYDNWYHRATLASEGVVADRLPIQLTDVECDWLTDQPQTELLCCDWSAIHPTILCCLHLQEAKLSLG